VREAAVQHVRLQRVVRGGEPLAEREQAVEVGLAHGRVGRDPHIGARREPPQVDVDERGLVEDPRQEAHELLELVEQELLVDAERAEAAAPRVLQVARDQRRQVRDGGMVEALQQRPQPVGVQRRGRERPQPALPEPVERPRVQRERALGQPREREQLGVQPGRQVGLGAGRAPLGLEAQPSRSRRNA
jgi:hypothetical protein